MQTCYGGYRIALIALIALSGTVFSKTINFTEDTSNFCNPDRGLFTQQGALTTSMLLNNRKDKGMTLEMVYYRLDDWVSVDVLPQTFLDKVKTDAAEARKAGCRMIPRFVYSWGCENPPDPPLSRILSHITQLTPVLRANSDVISHIQAGLIGGWGEWHHSGCTDPNNLDNTDARRQIVFKLLDAVPNRCVAVRYPYMVKEMLGANPLGPDSAFSGTYKARTGGHNDCFRGSATDVGTYHNNMVEMEKQFASQFTRYTPQSGETCSGCNPYNGCDSIIKDYQRLHWDGMKNQVDQCLVTSWQPCWSTIQKKMGYRLKLTKAILQDSVRPGYAFSGTISLINIGWGKMYNYHGCELVFRNTVTKSKFKVSLGKDPRTWTTAYAEVNVPFSVVVPSTATEGAYTVYLSIPDTAQSIATRPEYAVRLANNGVWEDSTGYNSLQHTVIISPIASTVTGRGAGEPFVRSSGLSFKQRGNLVDCFIGAKKASTVTFEIVTLSGKVVSRLDAIEIETGRYGVLFNASKIPSKVYLLRARIDGREIGGLQFVLP
jgi:hypothetical protein